MRDHALFSKSGKKKGVLDRACGREIAFKVPCAQMPRNITVQKRRQRSHIASESLILDTGKNKV